MSAGLVVFIVVFLQLVQLSNQSRILVYNPLLGQSHVFFMNRIAEVLEQDGHQVTVLAPTVVDGIRFDETRFKDVRKIPASRETTEAMKSTLHDNGIWDSEHDSVFAFLHKDGFDEVMYQSCKTLLNQTQLLEELRNEKFDLGIAEYFDACGLGIFHEIGLKNYALASSTTMLSHLAEDLGMPTPMAYVPGLQSGQTSEELTSSILLRLKNLIVSRTGYSFFRTLAQGSQRAFHEHSRNFPLLQNLAAEASLVITNTEPLLDFPRPTLDKVVNLGGIAVPTPKNISQEWRLILSQRPQNVLISFGSVARSVEMPREKKEAIVETVKRFPEVTFVWKYEDDDDVGKGVENLVKSKWTPQADLLNSGLISAFVTHGGMGSVMETIHGAVPCVAVGLFGDQMRNAAMLQSHGVGIRFSKWDLAHPNKIEDALKKVLHDPSYTKNIRRLSSMLKSRPFSPKELLKRHVRFVAENGPLPQLRPGSTRLSFVQLYLLDVLIFVFLTVALFVLIVLYLVRLVLARLRAHLKTE